MSVSKWDYPPPLCALTGSEPFLIQMELDEARSSARKMGRAIVESHDKSKLDSVFVESLWSDQKYLVIHHGGDFDQKKLWKHWESSENDIAVVLVPGKAKPSILKKLPQKLVAKFEAPKPWDREEWAVKFVIREAKKRGVGLSETNAKALVTALGDRDLGILLWQLWKLKYLVRSRGDSHVSVKDLRDTLIDVSSVGSLPLVKIVGYKKFGQLSFYVKKAKENNPNVLSVLGLLIHNLRIWIQVKSLVDRDVDEIANRINGNQYIVRTEILPLVARWSLDELISLLGDLVKVRRNTKQGSVDPWLHLESVLLQHLWDKKDPNGRAQ